MAKIKSKSLNFILIKIAFMKLLVYSIFFCIFAGCMVTGCISASDQQFSPEGVSDPHAEKTGLDTEKPESAGLSSATSSVLMESTIEDYETNNDTRYLFKQGMKYLDSGCYEDSSMYFYKVTQLKPRDSSAWLKLGHCFTYLDEDDLAEQCYDTSSAILDKKIAMYNRITASNKAVSAMIASHFDENWVDSFNYG